MKLSFINRKGKLDRAKLLWEMNSNLKCLEQNRFGLWFNCWWVFVSRCLWLFIIWSLWCRKIVTFYTTTKLSKETRNLRPIDILWDQVGHEVCDMCLIFAEHLVELTCMRIRKFKTYFYLLITKINWKHFF